MHLLSLFLLFCVSCFAKEPRPSMLIYDLPIENHQGVTITPGPLFTLDFVSTLSEPGKILAAREGVVVALHDKAGWIVIQHEFIHEVSFYAHLGEIKVQVGESVKRGQEIGTEGLSRRTSFGVYRSLEESLNDTPPCYNSQYESIPYRLQYFDETLHVTDIRDFFTANNRPQCFPVSRCSHPLILQLKKMYQEDQDACREWIHASDDKKEEKSAIVMNIRREHNPFLKEVIQQYGWPGFARVGAEASEDLWLLIQHQDEDPELQKAALGCLKGAVDQNQADVKNYAYLLDRIRMGENLPQVYGTQWIGEKGFITLYQVEDEEKLDERRIEANLPTISEYKKMLQAVYHLTDEDFKDD